MLSDDNLRDEVQTFFDKIKGNDQAVSVVAEYMRSVFDAAVAVFTVADVADQLGRELTDDEKVRVKRDWIWRTGLEMSLVSKGLNEIGDMILYLGLEPAEGEFAGECIYCKQSLVDVGVVLVDKTGGDACGVPLDSGAEHSHCNGFAYDPGMDSDSQEVCSTCLCHRKDHVLV